MRMSYLISDVCSSDLTHMSAISLSAMSLGVPAFMLSKVLAPAFYARQDMKTPMRAAIITVVANVLLTAGLTAPLWLNEVTGAHVGLALATALAGILNAALLWRFLRRGGLFLPTPAWRRFAQGCPVAITDRAAVVTGMLAWI